MDIERLQKVATQAAADQGFVVGARQQGFSGLLGPFFERDAASAAGREYALFIDERHLNPEGFVHGGVLASMIDYVLYRVAGKAAGAEFAVPTVDLQIQYLGAVKAGACVIGTGKVLRETRSLVFVHGELAVAGELVLAASGVYKKIRTA